MMNLDSLTEKFAGIVASHELGEGKYARWLWQNKAGNRDLGNNEYGCADGSTIHSTWNMPAFPSGIRKN